MYQCTPLFVNTSGHLRSGTMSMIYTGDNHRGISSFEFFPTINLRSSDMNCIQSMLLFVDNEAQKYGCRCVITFDQPLFIKALMILTAEVCPFKDTILRLGGFHTMCFLACIGDTMEYSALAEAMAVVYAHGSVPHILNGKSYSRGIRSHSIIGKALTSLLILEKVKEELSQDDIEFLESLFNNLIKDHFNDTTLQIDRAESLMEKINMIGNICNTTTIIFNFSTLASIFANATDIDELS